MGPSLSCRPPCARWRRGSSHTALRVRLHPPSLRMTEPPTSCLTSTPRLRLCTACQPQEREHTETHHRDRSRPGPPSHPLCGSPRPRPPLRYSAPHHLWLRRWPTASSTTPAQALVLPVLSNTSRRRLRLRRPPLLLSPLPLLITRSPAEARRSSAPAAVIIVRLGGHRCGRHTRRGGAFKVMNHGMMMRTFFLPPATPPKPRCQPKHSLQT